VLFAFLFEASPGASDDLLSMLDNLISGSNVVNPTEMTGQ
jgi:hypothetical protein